MNYYELIAKKSIAATLGADGQQMEYDETDLLKSLCQYLDDEGIYCVMSMLAARFYRMEQCAGASGLMLEAMGNVLAAKFRSKVGKRI